MVSARRPHDHVTQLVQSLTITVTAERAKMSDYIRRLIPVTLVHAGSPTHGDLVFRKLDHTIELEFSNSQTSVVLVDHPNARQLRDMLTELLGE